MTKIMAPGVLQLMGTDVAAEARLVGNALQTRLRCKIYSGRVEPAAYAVVDEIIKGKERFERQGRKSSLQQAAHRVRDVTLGPYHHKSSATNPTTESALSVSVRRPDTKADFRDLPPEERHTDGSIVGHYETERVL